MKINVKISTTVSKLGYQIPSVSLHPSLSCRHDAPCAHGCYGKKGNFRFDNVQQAEFFNSNYYFENGEKFFEEIASFLNDGLVAYKYFRWHVVGDIVNIGYFCGMIKTAKKCKNVKFLCFTKKFDIVNSFIEMGGKIPSNLKIVFSAWNKGFEVNNPYDFPMAYVNFKKKENNPDIPELAIPCVGKCEMCQSCWSLKKGQSVVFNQH